MPRFNAYPRPQPGEMAELDTLAADLVNRRFNQWGYPFDQDVAMEAYNRWLADTGLADITLINVGDPWKKDWDMLSSDVIERRVLDFWAERYGFENNHWGVITNGGTDGNMHGLYFGRKVLEAETGKAPILYVSEEAHYSVKKLADIQNIEECVVRAVPTGQMDTADLEAKLDPSRPALIAVAVGGTFKSAVDDQAAINDVIERVRPCAVYRHVDMALMGGYLPFLDDPEARAVVDTRKMRFDSLAVSGHKFIALNEPCGVFLCRREVLERTQSAPIPYLADTVIPTISCSRSGFAALKMYWRILTTTEAGFREQAEHVLAMTEYMRTRLEERGVFALVNPHANTICFTRPADRIVHEYALACNHSAEFGDLAHVVVMQYFTRELIDRFIEEMTSSAAGVVS